MARILRSVLQLLFTANFVPILLIPSTPMMEAICTSETPVLTRAAQRHIPEDGILHSYCRENLKSYIAITGWALYRRYIFLSGTNWVSIYLKTTFFIVIVVNISNPT
jgi:hypothetical protein